MRLQYHAASSFVVSGILFLVFKSWSLSASALIAGIFIDLDHFIDYFREHGWSLRARRFFQVCHKCQFDKIMLVWHGWEWVLLLVAMSWITDWNPLITGIMIGISHHLLFDTICSGSNFKTYSLLWRWSKDFDFDTIFPGFKEIKYRHRVDLNKRDM